MQLTLLLFLSTAFSLSAQSPTPSMTFLPGGSFTLGDSTGDSDERPVHPVQILPFYIGKYEVTVREFKAFTDATGYRTDAERGDGSYAWDGSGWNKKANADWRTDEQGRLRPDSALNRPVSHVSWMDAVQYCNWLSQTGKFTPVYTIRGDTVAANVAANGYRLPTEAEWEYAAAAGLPAKKFKWAGSNDLSSIAWFSNNSSRRLHAVGLKQSNAAGIFDLTGNVWEWCHDWYSANWYVTSAGMTDPTGPAFGTTRTLRGGSMNNNPTHCRIANRSSRYPDYRDCNVGFRIVRR